RRRGRRPCPDEPLALAGASTRMPQTKIDETPVKPSPPGESAARTTRRPGRRWARVAGAWVRHPARRTRAGVGRRERPSESSIDRAMADAEQNGLWLHLRVRLALLAVVAVSLLAYYAPGRSIPGLVVVATFAASGLVGAGMGGPSSGPAFSISSKRHC